MGKFHDKMLADLVLRGRSINTQRSYLFRAREFVAHFRRPPTELGTDHVREFLLHIVNVRKLGPSSHGVYVSALKFLFEVTLERPEVVASIPAPRRPRVLPDILSHEEVARFFEHVHSMRQRALLMTAYGAGLRVSEACNLRVEDIDSSRMVIHVRGGKGAKDRFVMLSPRLLETLRLYWKTRRPPRPFLFPGRTGDKPITRGAVHKAVRAACLAAGITKHVSPHKLRHAFATHLLEAGTNLRVIQALLGHASINSTARYASLAKLHAQHVTSPLDLLPNPADPKPTE